MRFAAASCAAACRTLACCNHKRRVMSVCCDTSFLFATFLIPIVSLTVKQSKPVERRGRKATGLSAARPTIAGLPLEDARMCTSLGSVVGGRCDSPATQQRGSHFVPAEVEIWSRITQRRGSRVPDCRSVLERRRPIEPCAGHQWLAASHGARRRGLCIQAGRLRCRWRSADLQNRQPAAVGIV